MIDTIVTFVVKHFVLWLMTTALVVVVTDAYGQKTEAERTMMKVKMGEVLFFDQRLSIDGTMSCASCHDPQKGFSDGLRTAVGVNGAVGPRHTPTIYTKAFHPLQFADGRTLGVDAQSLQPLTNPLEMGNDSVNQVVRRIRPKYNRLSRALYGKDFDAAVMAESIARYEGSVLDTNLPVHKRLEGFKHTFGEDPQAERGYRLFVNKGCMNCHTPPMFTDMAFHNNGISFVTNDDDPGRIGILPQGSERNSNTVRAFKTETLIGIGESAPYTHRGNVGDLITMVKLYNSGMVVRRNDGRRVVDRFLDERIRPLGMDEQECQDLAHFLEVGFTSKVRTAVPEQ
jgi:cytochrome c peroxidase